MKIFEMSLAEQIRPINGKHSIKEAVLSLFLPNPIIKPERFKILIEKEFKDIFQQFEPVTQLIAEIKNEKGVFSNSFQTLENIGFKFSAFKGGKIEKVLQCANQANRYFISYHDLNYNRWSDFFSSFIQLMKVFQQYDNSIFINAFSLHYVDEFLWTDEGNPIDSSVIFARNSKYLPSEFFKPGKTNFSFITERHLESGSKVFDRIEVKVEPTIVPVVNISHSVTYPLTDFYHLNSVVDNSFSPFFESVHAKNKALLRDLLNPEVCKLIGI